MPKLQALYNKINYHFKNDRLLKQALTHASYFKVKQMYIDSERFEFLGDRVLNLIIAEHLFATYPDKNEGQLAKCHAHLVSSDTIVDIMNEINLKKFVFHDLNKNNIPNSIIGDIGEALIAAIYLDSGFETVRRIVLNLWQKVILHSMRLSHDPKSDLQEYAQKNLYTRPSYEIISISGTDHQPQYNMRVILSNGQTAQGTGSSKKKAEQMAALQLLTSLQLNDIK